MKLHSSEPLQCLYEILPIENKMADPGGYIHPVGVLNTGMAVIICVNTAVAFYGYLCFGEESQGSITLNVPERPYTNLSLVRHPTFNAPTTLSIPPFYLKLLSAPLFTN
ncbi:unnamed protein product [Echinostoma caproni]|uniref:Aa_trans domain-containing protein n=1 Tax=Echinostoma caproni TaxID=27848 RepID=A0A183AMQ7_9TREM|nr:unnamed protein product [Echinostoma caproni]